MSVKTVIILAIFHFSSSWRSDEGGQQQASDDGVIVGYCNSSY